MKINAKTLLGRLNAVSARAGRLRKEPEQGEPHRKSSAVDEFIDGVDAKLLLDPETMLKKSN
jgi:hypothetical protein